MNEYVSLMTVAQFKAFRKAIRVLTRARLTRTQAVEILVTSMMDADRYRASDYARAERFGS